MNEFDIFEFIVLCGLSYLSIRYIMANTKYYNFKRVLILSIIPIIAVLSFSSFEVADISVLEYIPLNDDVLLNGSGEQKEGTSHNWILIVYLIGVAISLTMKMIGVISIKKIFNSSVIIAKRGDIKVYQNNKKLNFCFWKSVTVSNSENQDVLIEHELQHIMNKHYIDLLVSNIYTVLFWFNPFVNLLNKELQAIHEFQADSKTNHNLEEMIPELIPMNKNVIAITSNHSLINYKRRIEMKISNKRHIPSLIVGVMLLFFSAGMTAITSHSAGATEITTSDVAPTYKGNLMADLVKELKYPKSAYEDKIEGKTVVKVKIDKDGNQVDTQIAKSSGNSDLDDEAVRAVKTLKDWNPGTVGEKAVATWVQIPVKFKLP
ncbi:MAG: TonB family protein [Chlorobiota bacterium]